MQILNVQVSSFGSYKTLEFDFTQKGLLLISGPTGSGKSTLCDVIPWILFGKTAKGGTVDEIRSWAVNEPTKGTITLDLQGKTFQVGRVRGSAKENDLIIWEDGGAYRGKDLNDTQAIINRKLGIYYELYLAGAYYHEFNETAQFFTTTAKTRRHICEQLVDLSLAVKLKDKAKVKDKELYQGYTTITNEMNTLKSNVALLARVQSSEKNKARDWETNKQSRITSLATSYSNFESGRKRTISKKCNTCGTQLEHEREVTDTSENPYLSRLEVAEAEENPHTETTKDFSAEIQTKKFSLLVMQDMANNLRVELEELAQLSDIIDTFRSAFITNTIISLEHTINQLLNDYFDAEIRVKFKVESADKLNVTIHKDGNVCTFTQLSKGQRQLLKLTFGLAVMKAVQNHHSVVFNQVFIDEGCDGLDETMKLKALRMLQNLTLSYESVFLVEHSEAIKAAVDNNYKVTLVNGESHIEKI